ncbi:MAG: biliverdin-producing heme oxygenase [Methylocystis sp.]
MVQGAIVRDRLRRETAEIHERLHRHSGLGAAARGSITPWDYAQLLARLFGFHRAYESVLSETACEEAIDPCFYAVARSESLALDLAALGLDRAAIARLPLCATIARPSNAAELLGARYVVEGSALGSQLIARALEPSFGENRRFFLSQPGNAWRVLTDLLETLAGNPPAIEAAAGAARAIFLNFEMWMDGWKNPELFAIVGGEEGMELAPPAGR